MRHRYEFTLNDKDPEQAKIVELLSHMGGMRSGFIKSLLSAYVARYGTQIPGVSELFDAEPIRAVAKTEKRVENQPNPVPMVSSTEQKQPEPTLEVAPEPMIEKEPDPIPEPVETVSITEQKAVAMEQTDVKKPDKAFLTNALAGLM